MAMNKKPDSQPKYLGIDRALGYIMMPRGLLQTAFFVCEKTWKVYTYCHLKANHKDNWIKVMIGQGSTEVFIKRGQFLYGRDVAAKECNMVGGTIDYHLLKLSEYGAITRKSGSHYSIITVCEYDYYQSAENYSLQQTFSYPASNQQDNSNELATDMQPTFTNKNDKNDKNVKFIKPTINEITDYCTERNNNINAERFFDHYEANGWMTGKNKLKDWKAAVRNWEKNQFSNSKKGGGDDTDF
jgi:hypothetical protein